MTTRSCINFYFGYPSPDFSSDGDSSSMMTMTSADDITWDCNKLHKIKNIVSNIQYHTLKFPRIFMIGRLDIQLKIHLIYGSKVCNKQIKLMLVLTWNGSIHSECVTNMHSEW